MKFAKFAICGVLAAFSTAAMAEDVTPSVRIVSPADGAVVVLGDDPNRSVPIEIAVDDFVMKKLGTCGDVHNCGHAHLWVDPPEYVYKDLTVPPIGAPGPGATCDNKGFPANNQNAGTGASTVAAHFGNCPLPAGKHVIVVGLGRDNHLPVAKDGKPILAIITITTVDAKKADAGAPQQTAAK